MEGGAGAGGFECVFLGMWEKRVISQSFFFFFLVKASLITAAPQKENKRNKTNKKKNRTKEHDIAPNPLCTCWHPTGGEY